MLNTRFRGQPCNSLSLGAGLRDGERSEIEQTLEDDLKPCCRGGGDRSRASGAAPLSCRP